MTLLYGFLVGVAMGALIQRVGASSPRMILKSLRLEDLTIIKFMATTIAVGAIASYFLNMATPMHFDVKPTYIVGVALGGLIFGVGFALAGYCPGTCVVGIAEGRKDGLVALLGGVVGAAVFSVIYRLIEAPLIRPLAYGKITFADLLGVPGWILALILGALFLTIVAVVPTRPRKAAA